MVTHEHPPPVAPKDLFDDPPAARAAVVNLGADSDGWAEKTAASGTLLFGDVGWDATEQWSEETLEDIGGLAAFLPNSAEAMAHTRTEDPRAALMAFGNLCAGLAVQQIGGSLAAPGWGDIVDWFDVMTQRSRTGSRPAVALHHSYEFLQDVIPYRELEESQDRRTVRRAGAAIARFSDA